MFCDVFFGGIVSVYYVGVNGWIKVIGDDVGELYFLYYSATSVDDVDAYCGGEGKKEVEVRVVMEVSVMEM